MGGDIHLDIINILTTEQNFHVDSEVKQSSQTSIQLAEWKSYATAKKKACEKEINSFTRPLLTV